MGSKIAVLGAGMIGTSWAAIFAQAGHDIVLYDCNTKQIDQGINSVVKNLNDLHKYGLVKKNSKPSKNIQGTSSLSDALTGAVYAQESVFEDLETKISFYKEIDSVIDSNTIVGSSSSSLIASAFTEKLSCSHRCLVVHPVNPPHLIPLVEIVPKPSTNKSVTSSVKGLMLNIGMDPIVLSREIDGFILNRLQGALLNEAFYLLENGIASAEDIDKTLSKGLGRRWAFMGPFETLDLNAPEGIIDYCNRYSSLYLELAKQFEKPKLWDSTVVEKLSVTMKNKYPNRDFDQRQKLRDRRLAALAAHLADDNKI
ncbi:MAG: 3-hydroxyacyl-CoA dehydrogenase [Gammaproteobacteria bacterium]|nr:3-hydroxyacyl-CoA dehydrogenase [Gammaproteobacteria bacterium]|tara:strand:+ start:703 stop:1638 length:936 start_codon:yes stop_codon:yes gene_type:complete